MEDSGDEIAWEFESIIVGKNDKPEHHEQQTMKNIKVGATKHKTPQKFRYEWTRAFPWVQCSEVYHKAFCIACERLLSNNIKHIERHGQSKRHIESMVEYKNNLIKKKKNKVESTIVQAIPMKFKEEKHDLQTSEIDIEPNEITAETNNVEFEIINEPEASHGSYYLDGKNVKNDIEKQILIKRIEILDKESYLKDLEILQKEKELDLPPSRYTRKFYSSKEADIE